MILEEEDGEEKNVEGGRKDRKKFIISTPSFFFFFRPRCWTSSPCIHEDTEPREISLTARPADQSETDDRSELIDVQ